jgi:hypothetical protein
VAIVFRSFVVVVVIAIDRVPGVNIFFLGFHLRSLPDEFTRKQNSVKIN